MHVLNKTEKQKSIWKPRKLKIDKKQTPKMCEETNLRTAQTDIGLFANVFKVCL